MLSKNEIFMEYVYNNKLDRVKTMLSKNEVDINFVNKKDGNMTPLLMACEWGDMDMIEFLLKNGADISAKDIHGRTVLHFLQINFARGWR